jgi:hypothetical protein
VDAKTPAPRGQQLVDSLGPAEGVFASGDKLFTVSPPRYEPMPLRGFNQQDLADAVQKQLLGKANYALDGQEVYMKRVKS